MSIELWDFPDVLVKVNGSLAEDWKSYIVIFILMGFYLIEE